MKKVLLIFLAVTLVAGCKASPPGTGDGTYRAELLIGGPRARVLKQTEQMLGVPVHVGFFFKGTPAEVEIRRYVFSSEHEVVLYFHKRRLIQAGLILAGAESLPNIRTDFRDVKVEHPGEVRGYLLEQQGGRRAIDTLFFNGNGDG